MSIDTDIIRIAKSYIGKTELPGNSGFLDGSFEKKMKDVGWSKGLSWCSFFAELVWKEAYNGDLAPFGEVDGLFSGSATGTFKNFDLNKDWETSPDVPQLGSLVVWRHGNSWQGHIGIVIGINGDKIDTVEGNTNDKGGREGYIVGQRSRKLDLPFSKTGLNLIGFVYPR